MNPRRSSSVPWLCLALVLPAAGCSGGGASGGNGAAGAGGNLRPFAIDDAASPAVAADVRDLLEVGDHFAFGADIAQANAIYDGLWARLVSANEWLEPGDNTTYEFFDDTDPITNWGRAYRYSGQGVFAGPIVPFTAGTYTQSSGVALPAVTLQTWDGSHAELLVMIDDDTLVHAIQNTNGLPIVEVFGRR